MVFRKLQIENNNVEVEIKLLDNNKNPINTQNLAFKEGEKFSIVLTNNSSIPVYFNLVDIYPDNRLFIDPRLKNKYDLLWDQKSPEGYLKIMAVLQKYIDQGISVNTSYNPEHYEDDKVPMSVLLQDIITFYKYGGKQLYYNNTHDGQGEIDITKDEPLAQGEIDDDDCDSCKI